MNSNRINIELHVDDKGSITVKKFGDQTTKSMDQSRQSVGKFSDKSSAALASLKSHWMAITAATAGAVAIAKQSIGAFMEQESAEMKLAVAMGNAGTYTRANYQEMKKYASAQQQITKYGDEVTLATMANLQTYGMSTDALKAATKATMDLASAKGLDLRAASELVGKAFVGETSTLSRYGITLDDGIPKTEKFSAVLGLIEKRFGGTAQAELETYGGQWKQISNWWGDIAEKVGFGLLKTLEAVQFALGMAAAGFYTLYEGAFAGLSKLVSYAERIPVIGDKFKGMREGLDFIAGGFEESKKAALKFADTNYTMLAGFDRVEKFAEKTFKGIAKEAVTSNKIEYKSLRELAIDAKELRASLAVYAQKTAAEEVKVSEKTRKAQEKALKDYATESTRIYDKLQDDFVKSDQATVQQKLDALNLAYRAKREHLTALAAQDARYAEGVRMLDQQNALDKQALWDTEVQKHGSVMDRMELRWRDYQREGIDANKIMYDAIDAGAANLEGQMSDNFFNVLTGKMDQVSLDWNSMWDAMARSAADYMARIATETALNTGAKAASAGMDWLGTAMGWWEVGSWNIKKEQLAALHPGEMVIPADTADKIRAMASGSTPNVGTQAALGEPFDASALGGMADSFLDGLKGNMQAKAIGATAMAVTGKMGWGQALGAVIGGIPLASAAGLVQSLTSIALDAAGKLTGTRENEDVRGYLEGRLGGGIKGFALGRQALDAYMAMVLSEAGNIPYGNINSYIDSMSGAWDKAAATSWAIMDKGLSIFDYDVSGNLLDKGPTPMFDSWGDMFDAFSGGGSSPGSGGPSHAGSGPGGSGGGYSGHEGSGLRYGGISRGPESGYVATLHGTELVVSQKSDVPATVQGGGGTVVNITGPLVAIEGDNHVFDDKFVEKLTRRVRTELRNLEALRH